MKKINVVDSLMGKGKAQPMTAKVLTKAGFKYMKDLNLQDEVFGEDGKLHKLVGIFPQGIKDIYRVTFSDGTYTECCKEHLWSYQLPQDKNKGVMRTDTLENIMKMKLFKPTNRRDKNWQIFIPITKPINFEPKEIHIEPWLLGCLLGDGCTTNNTPMLSNPEKDIISKVGKVLNEYKMKMVKVGDTCDYRLVGSENNRNILNMKLEKYGLKGKKSDEKFIPNEFKYNSVEVRLGILRGLIDTDGSVTANGCVDYSTASFKLCEDIKEIVQSLGGTATYGMANSSYTKEGIKVECKLRHRLYIHIDMDIFSSEKHKNKIRKHNQRGVNRSIRNIEFVGKKECQCIKVDNPTELYLTNDYIVTHNTTWAIQNITMYNRHEKFLYVTPYLDEVDRIVDSCRKAMIMVSTPSNNHKGSKSEHLKQLMKQGKNIVTTHALFDRIDEECLDVIRSQGYTLYMDEVHEVVRRHIMSDNDLNLLLESKYIEIDERGKVSWIAEDYVGKFEEFKNLCNLGSMYKYSNYIYIWCFPVSIFEAMSKIYILTYYFQGQIQNYYYQLHGMDYDMKEVYKCGDTTYDIRDYNIIESHKEIQYLVGLINVYEGNLNYEEGITLSSTWFDRADKDILKLVANNTLNYFQNIIKGKSEDNMWTTIKAHKSNLKGKGYTKGFVELNARATNKYKHKKNLAYVYNRYLNPIEKNFFISHGIQVNEDLFALSELLQWIFRSQIREGKPINLYLPSKRMREKVYGLWLNLIDSSCKYSK